MKSQMRGLAAARKVLKKMPEKVQKSILNSASGGGARLLAKAVKANAPVGSEFSQASAVYGSLQLNIRVRKLRYDIPKGVSVHRVTTDRAFWGMFLEFGTARMAAQPFFRPAIDATTGTAFTKVQQIVGRRLVAEAKKLAGKYSVAKKRF